MDYHMSNPTNNEHTISMTAFIPNLSEENRLTYRLSRTIRLLSFIDVFFGLFMLFFGNVCLLILIRVLCSISGYYGAKQYSHYLSSIYTSFITLSTIGEVLLIYIYDQQYQKGEITKDMLQIGILYQIIFFLLKAYILRFICKFLSALRSLSVSAKTELILYDKQPVEIVYW